MRKNGPGCAGALAARAYTQEPDFQDGRKGAHGRFAPIRVMAWPAISRPPQHPGKQAPKAVDGSKGTRVLAMTCGQQAQAFLICPGRWEPSRAANRSETNADPGQARG